VVDYAVEEIAFEVWRVDVAGAVRIIQFRPDNMTYAPWDICTEQGRRLWASPTLESALRWIEARTGHPVQALFTQGLLERSGSNRSLEMQGTSERLAEHEESARNIVTLGLRS
jgi:hypothetical protein